MKHFVIYKQATFLLIIFFSKSHTVILITYQILNNLCISLVKRVNTKKKKRCFEDPPHQNNQNLAEKDKPMSCLALC